LTVSTNANIVLRKSVSVSNGSPGGAQIYTYTLSHVNNSQTAAGKTVITDTLPAGLTYVAGSGVWNQGNTKLTDAVETTNNGYEATVGTTSINYSEDSTSTINATLSRVPAQSQGTISFSFTVPATTKPGALPNIAKVSYDDGSGTQVSDSSNTVFFQVAPKAGFTIAGQTLPDIKQGATAVFNLDTVTNNGTGTDTFNISLDPNTTSKFPQGTTFQLFKSDGATPLLDTNGDGIPDTGPLAASTSTTPSTYNVVVKAFLPSNGVGGPFIVNVTAASTVTGTGAMPPQTAQDQVSVTATSVELTNNDGAGGFLGAGAITTTPVVAANGAPGTTQHFPLHVANNGAPNTSDSFIPSVSTSNPAGTALPVGYTVVFRDAKTGQVISSVDNVAGGTSRDIIADVFIPKTAQANDTTPLYFSINSPTTNAGDTIFDQVTVSMVRGISVKDPDSGQVFPSSSTTYLHTITNTGDVTETNVKVGDSGDANGFSSAVYLDANNNGTLDAGDTPLTSIPSLAPGASVGVFVKVFGPSDASQVGRVNTTTLTATLDGDLSTPAFDAGGPSANTNDATTLVVGDVKLDKFQSLTEGAGSFVRSSLSAKPGDTIYYQIVVTNTGTADVKSVVVNDATPSYTLASTAIAATYTDSSGKAQTITGSPANGTAGSYTFPIGTLTPGSSSTINFAVTIQK